MIAWILKLTDGTLFYDENSHHTEVVYQEESA